MVLPVLIPAAMAAASAAVGLYKLLNEKDSASGATQEQRAAYGTAKLSSDRGATTSYGGLSDQVYGRAEQNIAGQSNQVLADALAMGRQTMLSSPLLIESLTKQALEKSAGIREKGMAALLGADTQAVNANLDKQFAKEEAAARRANEMAQMNKQAEAINRQIAQMREQRFMETATAAASTMAKLYGTGLAEETKMATANATTVNTPAATSTPTTAPAMNAANIPTPFQSTTTPTNPYSGVGIYDTYIPEGSGSIGGSPFGDVLQNNNSLVPVQGFDPYNDFNWGA